MTHGTVDGELPARTRDAPALPSAGIALWGHGAAFVVLTISRDMCRSPALWRIAAAAANECRKPIELRAATSSPVSLPHACAAGNRTRARLPAPAAAPQTP
jgi:hypothetical protein